MDYVFYALEISRGNQFFAASVDECRQMATAHYRYVGEDGDPFDTARSKPMAIYRVTIRQPDQSTLLELLNSMDECGQVLSKTLVTERELIAIVIE